MNYETATSQQLNSKLYNLKSGGHAAVIIPDYCADWNVTMPLAVEHGIDIELPIQWLGNVGTITKNIERGTDIQVDFTNEENPLRAIVICLIKVLESKNEQ